MPRPPEPPAPFGRYRLLKKLGEGGMATVILAEDTLLKRRVALKFPHFDQDTDGRVIERFYREARVAAQLDHPNLCRVHDVGEVGGVHYLCMPFVEGTPLATHAGKPWPPGKAIALVRRLAAALQELHARGLIHRDLKPANVMLRPDGSPVLMDFGLARGFGEIGTRLTAPGSVLGTPAYLAPEQANGDVTALGPATDVYGLGVILYELLTGKLPFMSPSVPALLAQVLTVPPRPPSQRRPGLDPALDLVCLKALAKDPARRYGSMAELAAALAALPAQPAVGPPPGPAVTCPGCGKRLKLPAGRRAGPVKCPGCRARVGVPADPPAPAPRVSPPTVASGPAGPAGRPGPARRRRRLLAVAAVPAAAGLLALVAVGAVLLLKTGTPDAGRPGTAPSREPPAAAQAPFDAEKAKQLQRAWAGYLGRPVEETLDLGGGEKLTLVLIPPGTFQAGSPPDEKERNPPPRSPAELGFDAELRHRVALSKPFYLGKFEVTQDQYQAVMGKGNNPSHFALTGQGKGSVRGEPTGRFPVDSVSWEDAVKFCDALGAKVGRKVTLPTEAEWEYACRAGTVTPFHFGSGCDGTQANCPGTSPYGTDQKGPYLGRTCPVGQYPANAWGLHDMHGNVCEWCRDWLGPYQGLGEADPERPERGPLNDRVVRGGSWRGVPTTSRAAYRDSDRPSARDEEEGFRVAVRLD
jgi:formylglycine-generating enzyme required for sulfatase activity/tRNA A-37 threonylcarbamoyl transferase component Bud32